MKKLLAATISLALIATMIFTGTVAFFTDDEMADNVFEVGYVDIIQHEEERDPSTQSGLDEFTQNQKLYPMVDVGGNSTETKDFDGTPVNLANTERFHGYLDKIVTVENKGKNAAYLRNIVAVPTGKSDEPWLHVHFGDAKNGMTGNVDWKAPYVVADVEIEGELYDLYVFDYIGNDGDPNITAGHFQPGDTTVPTLLGFWMDPEVNFEEKLVVVNGQYYDDPDGDGTPGTLVENPVFEEINGVKTAIGAFYYLDGDTRVYIDLDTAANHIYVASQAVQADGFNDFETAFASTFNGKISQTNHPWKTDETPGAGGEGGQGGQQPGDPEEAYVAMVDGVGEKPWSYLKENSLVTFDSSNPGILTGIDSKITALTISKDNVDAVALGKVGAGAVANTTLTKLTLKGDVTLKQYALYNFTSLQEVSLSGETTFEDTFHFAGCENLETVTIGNGVSTIPDRCFINCKKLATINIPSTVGSIGAKAFSGCEALSTITLPAGTTYATGDDASFPTTTTITQPST